eukprot:COSAG06_NODE_8034_length_2293_cov_1.428897_2_plen_146_part_00
MLPVHQYVRSKQAARARKLSNKPTIQGPQGGPADGKNRLCHVYIAQALARRLRLTLAPPRTSCSARILHRQAPWRRPETRTQTPAVTAARRAQSHHVNTWFGTHQVESIRIRVLSCRGDFSSALSIVNQGRKRKPQVSRFPPTTD